MKNQRGQSLVEYLIIVALVAVGTTAVMRVVGQNISAQFARISNVLHGNKQKAIHLEDVEDSHLRKRDLGDFINGAASRD